ncbi:TIGR03761 family integrating conjugative element protein, partial [Escherichia coli]|nr:TIGR03761 family integrating conjugative element protein [Escherichia coli]EIY1868526.1 TIGR03761 family integrating conjugative element protein [Escherichia coli]ELG5424491.1 TIGR03761 family integrating conjugative element protein [Escherichia coli]KNF72701.1 hypothetical protein WQ83_21320 [Escherichia coli]MBL6410316.1 TIGR03761 family integrating conjugative element protein [Escherichia coli]
MPQEKTGEVRKSEQVGALQSSLTIALHTRYAIRLWEGRRNNQKEEKQEKRPDIISMPRAIAFAGQATRDSARDNPYADMMLVRLENALTKATETIEKHLAWLDGILKNLPGQISLSDIKSSSPVNIGVYSSSPVGYRCVWLLIGYDRLVMKVFQVFHYGLISRTKRDELLNQGGYAVRRIYGIIQNYKSVSVTRADILSGTARGKEAVNRMGEPDPDVMSGKKRSVYSPPVKA